MSKSYDVAVSLKALFAAAVGANGPEVIGLDGADSVPERVSPNGRIIVDQGSPGKPEVDLSPPTYNYTHQLPVTVEAYASATMTAAQRVDAIIDILAAAIENDRTMGGAVDYFDATAAESFDEQDDAAPTLRVATFSVTATYTTTKPL